MRRTPRPNASSSSRYVPRPALAPHPTPSMSLPSITTPMLTSVSCLLVSVFQRGTGGRVLTCALRAVGGAPGVLFCVQAEDAVQFNLMLCSMPLVGKVDETRFMQWFDFHRATHKVDYFQIYDAGGVHESLLRRLEPYIRRGVRLRLRHARRLQDLQRHCCQGEGRTGLSVVPCLQACSRHDSTARTTNNVVRGFFGSVTNGEEDLPFPDSDPCFRLCPVPIPVGSGGERLPVLCAPGRRVGHVHGL